MAPCDDSWHQSKLPVKTVQVFSKATDDLPSELSRSPTKSTKSNMKRKLRQASSKVEARENKARRLNDSDYGITPATHQEKKDEHDMQTKIEDLRQMVDREQKFREEVRLEEEEFQRRV